MFRLVVVQSSRIGSSIALRLPLKRADYLAELPPRTSRDTSRERENAANRDEQQNLNRTQIQVP